MDLGLGWWFFPRRWGLGPGSQRDPAASQLRGTLPQAEISTFKGHHGNLGWQDGAPQADVCWFLTPSKYNYKIL